jgi:hypothetical protein
VSTAPKYGRRTICLHDRLKKRHREGPNRKCARDERLSQTRRKTNPVQVRSREPFSIQLAGEACNARCHCLVQLMSIRRRRRRAGSSRSLRCGAWIGLEADRSAAARGFTHGPNRNQRLGYRTYSRSCGISRYGQSEPGEIPFSRVVADLVAGTGLMFSERGSHKLKRRPVRWDLFAASHQVWTWHLIRSRHFGGCPLCATRGHSITAHYANRSERTIR